jgi:hypothetical protein
MYLIGWPHEEPIIRLTNYLAGDYFFDWVMNKFIFKLLFKWI